MSAPTFDATFQAKVVAMCIRDQAFAREVSQYLKPEYVESIIDRNIVATSLKFVKSYGVVPELTTLIGIIRDAGASPEELRLYVARAIELNRLDLREAGFIREKVNEFCKRQAMLLIAANLPTLIDKGEYSKAEELWGQAQRIGQEAQASFSNYYDGFERRETMREEMATGKVVLGVSTGFPEIDEQLYRKGYIRGGLTAVMAPSKRGKTAFMGQSALYTSNFMGFNVLYLSREVGQDILEDRLDAALTGTAMGELIDKRMTVRSKGMSAVGPRRGNLYIECRPSNSFTMRQTEALIESYFNTGRPIDIIFDDYIGIVRLDTPDDRYTGLGNAAKSMRGCAGKFGIAYVTGAQTNRDAVNKETAGMSSIGESFAIVQDCDLLMSINANEAELASGVRRINWAAARNEAEKTITVAGDMEVMQLIQRVLGVSS